MPAIVPACLRLLLPGLAKFGLPPADQAIRFNRQGQFRRADEIYMDMLCGMAACVAEGGELQRLLEHDFVWLIGELLHEWHERTRFFHALGQEAPALGVRTDVLRRQVSAGAAARTAASTLYRQR